MIRYKIFEKFGIEMSVGGEKDEIRGNVSTFKTHQKILLFAGDP